MAYIAPIVEGHGEMEALPALLHRLAASLGASAPRVNPPIRVKSGSFLNDKSYFSRQIELAASKAIPNGGTVLILLDCDNDCPATLGPKLLAQAQSVRGDARFLVALAAREYETWFIAAAASLRGMFGLRDDLERPANFETIRDAKGWLGERMTSRYDPVEHQLKMTRIFDVEQAKDAQSFHRLVQRLRPILVTGANFRAEVSAWGWIEEAIEGWDFGSGQAQTVADIVEI